MNRNFNKKCEGHDESWVKSIKESIKDLSVYYYSEAPISLSIWNS